MQTLTQEVSAESKENIPAHNILTLFLLLFPCWKQDIGHIRSEVHLAHFYVILSFFFFSPL